MKEGTGAFRVTLGNLGWPTTVISDQVARVLDEVLRNVFRNWIFSFHSKLHCYVLNVEIAGPAVSLTCAPSRPSRC